MNGLHGYDGSLSFVFGVLDVKLFFCFLLNAFRFSLLEYFDNAVSQMAKKYFYIRYLTVRSWESPDMKPVSIKTQGCFLFRKPIGIM